MNYERSATQSQPSRFSVSEASFGTEFKTLRFEFKAVAKQCWHLLRETLGCIWSLLKLSVLVLLFLARFLTPIPLETKQQYRDRRKYQPRVHLLEGSVAAAALFVLATYPW